MKIRKIKSQVHVSCDSLILNQLIENNISPSVAFDFGVRFLLAEKGLEDYPNNSFLTKIAVLQDAIKNLNNKEVQEISVKEDIDKELQEVFG
jgi:hypothetical protein